MSYYSVVEKYWNLLFFLENETCYFKTNVPLFISNKSTQIYVKHFFFTSLLNEIIVFHKRNQCQLIYSYLLPTSGCYLVSFILITSENFVRGKDDLCTGLNNEAGRCDYLRQCFYHEYESNFTLAVMHSCTIGKA